MRILACLLLCASAVGQAPTFYQSCNRNSSNVASLSCGSTVGNTTFAHVTVQPNDTIIIGIRDNALVTSVTDSTRGMTFLPVTPGGQGVGTWWIAPTGIGAASNDTFTVTTSNGGSLFWGMMAAECTGCTLSTTGVIAAANAISSSGGTAFNFGTFTSNHANEMVLGDGLSFSRQTCTSSSNVRFSTSSGTCLVDALQASAGSVTLTATWGSSANWITSSAAFKTQSGSYTYIQSQQASSGSTVNTFSLTTLSATGAGHFLACNTVIFAGQLAGLSDAANDRFISYSPNLVDPHGDHMQSFYAYNIAAGTTTVTMSGSGMSFPSLTCREYSGVLASSNPLDNSSPIDGWFSCTSSCVFTGSGLWTANTVPFPPVSSPTTGVMNFTCGGGTCQATLDALLVKPASGSVDFAIEYGDDAGANACTGSAPQWNGIVQDSNGSNWCWEPVTLNPVATGGYSQAFTF